MSEGVDNGVGVMVMLDEKSSNEGGVMEVQG